LQQRPEKTVLLQAIAQFLWGEAYPLIEDQRLKFRVLIAAHLASTVASELGSEAELIENELASLTKLFPDLRPAPAESSSEQGRRQTLARLNQDLAARLREGRFDSRQLELVRDHLKQVLTRTLAIVSPRFDTSAEIE
jgi:hypothetical protein